jgi:tRNA(Glu) U13 pseudouridine synthase TruD
MNLIKIQKRYLYVKKKDGPRERDLVQQAIKNIGRKVLNLNDTTFNKRLGKLIGRSFEMPYVSYCQPLCGHANEDTQSK